MHKLAILHAWNGKSQFLTNYQILTIIENLRGEKNLNKIQNCVSKIKWKDETCFMTELFTNCFILVNQIRLLHVMLLFLSTSYHRLKVEIRFICRSSHVTHDMPYMSHICHTPCHTYATHIVTHIFHTCHSHVPQLSHTLSYTSHACHTTSLCTS